MERFEAIISGRVQGVGFRFFAEAEAIFHGVHGFACNLVDGTVEVVAEGEKEKLLKFLHALEKGPPTGHVEKVKKSWGDATGEFKGFSIRH
ncbi:MAG TPA: acylphosphatase [archaeon]|nr:acylphosphatase [archaeon]